VELKKRNPYLSLPLPPTTHLFFLFSCIYHVEKKEMTYYISFCRKLSVPYFELRAVNSSQYLENEESILSLSPFAVASPCSDFPDIDKEMEMLLHPLLFLYTPLPDSHARWPSCSLASFSTPSSGSSPPPNMSAISAMAAAIPSVCIPKLCNNAYHPSHHYFCMLEIIDLFQCFQAYSKTPIKMVLLGETCKETIRCCKDYFFARLKQVNESFVSSPDVAQCPSTLFHSPHDAQSHEQNIDFLYFDVSLPSFLSSFQVLPFLQVLSTATKYQKSGGFCIFKLGHAGSRNTMEFIYTLTSLYETIHCVKPQSAPPMEDAFFLVALNFVYNKQTVPLSKTHGAGGGRSKVGGNVWNVSGSTDAPNAWGNTVEAKRKSFLDIAASAPTKPVPAAVTEIASLNPGWTNRSNIHDPFRQLLRSGQQNLHIRLGHSPVSFLRNPLPCLFVNKINQFLVLLAQLQLESQSQLMNAIGSNKLDSWKKHMISKAVEWCHRHKVTVNHGFDKHLTHSNGSQGSTNNPGGIITSSQRRTPNYHIGMSRQTVSSSSRIKTRELNF